MLVFNKRQALDLAEALFDACDNLQSEDGSRELATVDRVANTFVSVDDTFTTSTVAVVLEDASDRDGTIELIHSAA